MIRRAHRFHGHNSLRGIYNRGRTVRGPLCALKIAPASLGHDYRAAIVVSKKVSKSAVVRNRIRRRLYEAIRTSRLVDQPYDVIVTVFSDQLADLPAKEIEHLLDALLDQAGLKPPKAKTQTNLVS